MNPAHASYFAGSQELPVRLLPESCPLFWQNFSISTPSLVVVLAHLPAFLQSHSWSPWHRSCPFIPTAASRHTRKEVSTMKKLTALTAGCLLIASLSLA